MDKKYSHQSQFELFPGSVKQQAQNSAPRFFLRQLNLSLENLVVICIVMMVGLILCFSLGVERGKRIIRREMASADNKMAQTLQNTFGDESPLDVAQAAAASPQKFSPLAAGKAAGAVVNTSKINTPVAKEAVTDLNQKALADLSAADEAASQKNVDKEQNKGYTIQVASFKKDEFAQKEVTILKQREFEAIVVPKGSYSIVCVGRFDNKEEAKTFSKKLHGQYKDLVIRSL